MAHVKQWELGLIMYSAENNELLPFRDEWMDAAAPHLSWKPAEEMKCTELASQGQGVFGYAFNASLSRKNHEKIAQPDKVPMIYDSINYARNASDLFTSLPHPPRHKGYNVIGYADGHVSSKMPPKPSSDSEPPTDDWLK
jgi:prepilin-type processing-associated H-X9-DG protein